MSITHHHQKGTTMMNTTTSHYSRDEALFQVKSLLDAARIDMTANADETRQLQRVAHSIIGALHTYAGLEHQQTWQIVDEFVWAVVWRRADEASRPLSRTDEALAAWARSILTAREIEEAWAEDIMLMIQVACPAA